MLIHPALLSETAIKFPGGEVMTPERAKLEAQLDATIYDLQNRTLEVVGLEAELAAATRERDAWIDTAAQNQRNADYYRGLLVRCGESIGKKAYTQDDGGISDAVLCAKVPELVEAAFCKVGKEGK
jgi:hypothetical protein